MESGAGGIRGRSALLSVPHTDWRRHERELPAHDGRYGTGTHGNEGLPDEVSWGTAYGGGCFRCICAVKFKACTMPGSVVL